MKRKRFREILPYILTTTAISLGITITFILTSCGGEGKDNNQTEEIEQRGDVLRLSLDELTPLADSEIPDQEVIAERAAMLEAGESSDTAGSDTISTARPTPAAEIKKGRRHNDRIHINLSGRLYDLFNDSNKYQLEHAQRLGIEPIRTVGDAYRPRRPLVRVESNQYYHVDSLTHSLPFLVPEAERLLRQIGANFIDSLARRGADGYKIIVTSLLRTPSTVKRLRRVNVNATEQSTHQFATTFDLSYTRFLCADTTRTIHQGDLKNLLGEVLLDLRVQNRCLVKYERKTGCYHITATQ